MRWHKTRYAQGPVSIPETGFQDLCGAQNSPRLSEGVRQMNYGPVDLVVVQFEESTFTGKVLDELERLVSTNTLRVLDLIFVSKDSDGVIDVVELTDLSDPVAQRFDAFVGEIDALLSREDAQAVGSGLAPGASAGLLLYENVWARTFAAAVKEVGGNVLLTERIPQDLITSMQEEA